MSRRKWCLWGRYHPFAVHLPPLHISHEWKGLQCVISGFRRGVSEVFGYSRMSTQRWLVVGYRSFGTAYKSHLQGAMIQLDSLWMLLRSSCPDENCAWRDLSSNRTPFTSVLVTGLYEMLIYFWMVPSFKDSAVSRRLLNLRKIRQRKAISWGLTPSLTNTLWPRLSLALSVD